YEKARGDVSLPGLNSKMQEVSALVGLKNLSRIDFILASRNRQIRRYREFFGACEAKGLLKNMVVRDHVTWTYLYYPIILGMDAADFVSHMQSHGIAVRRYYTAVDSLQYYRDKYRELNLDFTNSIKDKIVSLPIHTIMSDEEVDYLFKIASQYFGDY